MTTRSRALLVGLALTLIVVWPVGIAAVDARTSPEADGQQGQAPPKSVEQLEQDRLEEITHLERRRTAQNGIVVSEPKVYDDALLQQMLNAAQARLASLQLLDQTGIAAKIGVLSGARQQISGFSLNVQTPSLAGVVTTAKGGTGSTVDNTGQAVNAEGKSSSNESSQTTTGLPSADVQTTAPQMAPPSASVAPASTSLPSGLSVSAGDVLNEQMQLTYEIANLRLLLDGALSDRLFADPSLQRVKRRTTLGLPITIDPDARYKDAVAIVEVEMTRGRTADLAEELSVTALLPREKTYNVAAIRDSTVSIGAGAVTQIVGVGGSWLRGRKTYYVVQDQDTVAMTFRPEADHTLGIAWQFRPVLGQPYVQSGQKQTFVQVALPATDGDRDVATLLVRTYWRRYDRSKNVLKDIVPGSFSKPYEAWPLPTFSARTGILHFQRTGLEDLGGGQMLVNVGGRFLPGTSVRVGSSFLRDGSPAMQLTPDGIKFIATVSDLANRRVAIVGRDGAEQRLQFLMTGTASPAVVKVTARPLDDTSSLLTVELAAAPAEHLIFVIGGRVFGYADAPIRRESKLLSAIVPTALIVANPTVKVTALFTPDAFADTRAIEGLDDRSRLERLVLVSETAETAIYLLYGSRFIGDTRVIYPADVTLESIAGGPGDEASLRLVRIKKADLKTQKNLVVKRPGEREVLIPIPPPVDSGPPKPEPKARARAVVNADSAIFDSDRLADLTGVSFGKSTLTFEVAKDQKSVTVTGLAAAGATANPEPVKLDFSFGTVKVSASLDVVSARVETVPR